MHPNDNPLLQPEDFLAGYRESAERLKDNPEIVLFDKLCYEVFIANPTGAKFMEYVTNEFLLKPATAKESPNARNEALWGEGFRSAFLMIRQCMTAHDQRIKAEMNNDRRNN